ncbi:MAG: MFS transporter [Phycisphaerae bacterium]
MTSVAAPILRTPPRALVTRRNLRYCAIDGIAFSVMVGLGEVYFARFGLAVGVSETAAGLLVSVPLLVGALIQLTTPAGVNLLRSMRAWVVLCAGTQALSFIPLAIVAARGAVSTVLLFALVALYWASGMATGPAWMTWITTIVPRRVRLRYFSRRTPMLQAGQVLAMLGGGAAMALFEQQGHLNRAFVVMFVFAGLSRAIGTFCLSRHTQPIAVPRDQRDVSPAALRELLLHSAGGRLLLFQLLMQVACYASGPYFTPYMIKHLHLDNTSFTILISTTFVAKVALLPLIGRAARRFGTRAVLTFGSVGIGLLPGLWMISPDFRYLLFVQVCSGATWAAFELTTMLLSLELIPENVRTSILTSYNLANACCMVGGSMIGAALLRTLGELPSTYMAVFAVSTALRLLTLVQMARFTGTHGPPHELAARMAELAAGTSGPAEERAVES